MILKPAILDAEHIGVLLPMLVIEEPVDVLAIYLHQLHRWMFFGLLDEMAENVKVEIGDRAGHNIGDDCLILVEDIARGHNVADARKRHHLGRLYLPMKIVIMAHSGGVQLMNLEHPQIARIKPGPPLSIMELDREGRNISIG